MSSTKLKVAFCNRPNWNNPLGGDGVQMLKTKEALEKSYDIEIDIITDPEHITDKYDIVHVFNYITTDITSQFFDRAKSLHLPIVSSSIFWDYSYISDPINRLFVRSYYSKFSAKLVKLTSKLFGSILGRPSVFSNKFKVKLRNFVDNSSLILPNSIEEAKLLSEFISKPDLISKARVVYNATDFSNIEHDIDNISEESFLKTHNIPKGYILQVGRIEYLKNQLNLVYALKNNPEIPIVFLGKIVDESYFKKIKQIADKRGNVFFVNAVPHDEVKRFYKFAKLHILLSLRESPGLVSLEALSHNCPIVISSEKFTPTSTYFPDQKYIVNPFDIKAIKSVVLDAYRNPVLRKDIIHMFNWNTTANQTYAAYKECLC